MRPVLPLLTLSSSNNRSTNVRIHTRPSRADPTAASFARLWGRNIPNPPKRILQRLYRNPLRHHHCPSHRMLLFPLFFLSCCSVPPKNPRFPATSRTATSLDPPQRHKKTQYAVRDICHLIKRLRGATCLYYHHCYFFVPGFCNYLCLLLLVFIL